MNLLNDAIDFWENGTVSDRLREYLTTPQR
jgi:hypothetical protein